MRCFWDSRPRKVAVSKCNSSGATKGQFWRLELQQDSWLVEKSGHIWNYKRTALKEKVLWLVRKTGYTWSWGTEGDSLPIGCHNTAPLLERAITIELCSVPLRECPSRVICFSCSAQPWPSELLLYFLLLKGKPMQKCSHLSGSGEKLLLFFLLSYPKGSSPCLLSMLFAQNF